MSQQRLIQLPLAGAFLLGLLAVVYFVWRRSAKPRPAIKKHHVATSPDDALRYWTADKMRKARPAEMPNVKTLEPQKEHPRHS